MSDQPVDAGNAGNPAALVTGNTLQRIYGNKENPWLDLVIAIDTSSSMSDEATALSKAVEAAMAAAETDCPCNARITYLGIQGTWPNTSFDQATTEYLIAHGVDPKVLTARTVAQLPNGAHEDLAPTVTDLSRHFDWRPGAKRAIMVLGDEGLYGGGGTLTADAVQATSQAIADANANQVKVYTYRGTPDQDANNQDRFPTPGDEANIDAEYKRMAAATNGYSYTYDGDKITDFVVVLKDVLCRAVSDPLPGIGTPWLHNGNGPDCGKVCESFDTVVEAVSLLASVLNKAIDSCCGSPGTDGGNTGNGGHGKKRHKYGCGCGCKCGGGNA